MSDLNPIIKSLIHKRWRMGLTQRDVASRMGVGQPMVGKIETGRDVRLSTLVKYADAMDMTLTLKGKQRELPADERPPARAADQRSG